MKTQACIWLSPEDRATLDGWVADRNTPQKLVWRARIVLLSAERAGKMAIVRSVSKSKRTVDRWQDRYVAHGLAGLRRDATRPGRKPPLSAAVIERVVEKTLHEKPPARTHWSVRTMAKAVGISHTSVQKIWQAHGLKPHLVKTFKLSNDKHFVDKVQDVVGLYLDPPDKALVFSVDEKSQILLRQAQDEGARPHAAGIADEEGAGWNDDARRQTPWHDHPVRRPQRRHRTSDRAMHEAAPPSGMAQIPARHRPHHAQNARLAPDRGQLRHA
jgi:transposase